MHALNQDAHKIFDEIKNIFLRIADFILVFCDHNTF